MSRHPHHDCLSQPFNVYVRRTGAAITALDVLYPLHAKCSRRALGHEPLPGGF